MTRYYLAARYSRREELLGYKAELEALGHKVYGRWLAGDHYATEAEILRRPEIGRDFAVDDLIDLAQADTLIAFTEAPHSTASRGGRHVEFGIAIAREMHLVVVGPRENVFHCLPDVKVYANWAEYLAEVAGG